MGNNLKEIRKKIGSVKNTQKTTRAMKLVSTSKLKKAEEMAKRSKVFASKLNEVFNNILCKMKTRGLKNINSKYFSKNQDQDVKKVDIIFVTADKGLCGGFNSNTIKEVLRLMNDYKEKDIKVRLRGIGKKGIGYFVFNDIEVLDKISDLSSLPDYDRAVDFATKVVDDYLDGLSDEILIVYNGFKNMISQEIRVKKLLPLAPLEGIDEESCSLSDVISIEPDDEEDRILEELAKKYIDYNMYYALIDSLAAEHSARMQAMDTATNNAGELVKSLTISYNKARQEAITTELVEINAGVEAMK